MKHNTSHWVGVDTGGTFTDFVVLEQATGRVFAKKVLSTPDNPARAILTGLAELGLEQAIAHGQLQVIHGSTVATNAALERKGVRTAFVTNKGLGDMLTIGRQTRAELYNLLPEPKTQPVPNDLCLEVDCRTDAQGQTITPLSPDKISQLIREIDQLEPESVAINLLFAYLNSADENAIKAALAERYFVSLSSEIAPEPGEYERGMATWLNAYLGPKVNSYLTHLNDQIQPCPLAVMQSNGGTISARQASLRAVNLLLSGPAGGLAATQALAELIQCPKLMTFDMGGTSTDVALVDGEISLTTEGKLGDWPVAVPMVDMHTIGAGGGSLAFADGGGLLQVGPESAGAYPGPACYGQGGTQPTVTDANALLGRLRPDQPLGGHLKMDVEAARHAFESLGQTLGLSPELTASGVIDLVNEHMTSALRLISINRGHNPKEFTLCCFGGAGGLHVCALADNLGMTQALVPAQGGVFSALGMLTAPRQRQMSQAHPGCLSESAGPELENIITRLLAQGTRELLEEGAPQETISHSCSLDLRYAGQSFCLTVDYQTPKQAIADFHQQHQSRYGHQLNLAVELVTVRVRVLAPPAVESHLLFKSPTLGNPDSAEPTTSVLPRLGEVTVYQRKYLRPSVCVAGPALICEPLATTLVGPNWAAEVDNHGNLRMTKATNT